MSEEVEVLEVAQDAEQVDPVGLITIEVTSSSVKYDTNLATPELVFWMDVVRDMVIKKVMEGGQPESSDE